MKFFRIVAVVVKTTFRPLVKYIHRTLSNSYHPFIEGFFYNVGKYSRILKIRIEKATTRKAVVEKEMERSKVVAYGAEIFFEYFCIYGFAVYLILNEFRKGLKETQRSKKNKEKLCENVMKLRVDFVNARKAFENFQKVSQTSENNGKVQNEEIWKELAKIQSELIKLEKDMKELGVCYNGGKSLSNII